MHVLIAVFLAALLISSLLREWPWFSTVLARFPTLSGFVPTWSFFGPIPGMHDYHLLCREIDAEGQVHDWKNICSPKEGRPFYAILWNPEKKLSKTMLDLTLELIRLSRTIRDERQICLSLPYLHLLNFISQGKETAKVQFMILSNSKLHDYKVEFLSNTHPLQSKQ